MAELLRILSIDGGGIRGILPGQVLVTLEQKLQMKTGDPQARLAQYFDFFAGTSTGGILTCLYLFPDQNSAQKPCFSAQEALNLYLNHGGTIFNKVQGGQSNPMNNLIEEKYPSAPMEKLLKKYFKSIRLSELLKPCLITSYNIFNRSTHFFSQHEARKNQDYDYFLKDVARATSAAPTYFQPARIKSCTGESYPLVDGGVFANNPALCAYAEARQHFAKENSSKKVTASDMFMLSIGTGTVKKSYDYDAASGWGSLGWVEPVLDIMLSGANDTVDFQLMQIFDAINNSENYIRIDPLMTNADTAMDNATPANIEALRLAGIATSEKFDAELERVAEFLVRTSKV